ncbi:PHP domain-containing protein [Kineosporia sp. A_224]|uniref:PHP domain-containing protein n=1 Tax=Kineosporia sp. A_224 TaxID=1962180 RepID=UPI000B4A8A24|nr:PHP domain-containing protein [Kineosporia sp. A_224]
MRIDLHAHSAASDGTDAPAEVVRAAVRAGLDVVALTDHDTTSGWEEAAATARRLGIALVPGMEISCQAGGISVHLLSYLHDPTDEALLAETSRTRDDRVGRARRMVERIAQDHPLTWDDVAGQVTDGATVGRPHIADALVARGVVASRDEAFAGILDSRSPYYVRHYAPGAADAVRLVRAAGGVPVMAHPRAGRRGRVVDDEVIAGLADAGLAGLEVDHRDHLPEERVALRGLARDLGLLVTGASDYHGTGKLNGIGEHTTSPAVLEAIEATATGTRVVRG